MVVATYAVEKGGAEDGSVESNKGSMEYEQGDECSPKRHVEVGKGLRHGRNRSGLSQVAGVLSHRKAKLGDLMHLRAPKHTAHDSR